MPITITLVSTVLGWLTIRRLCTATLARTAAWIAFQIIYLGILICYVLSPNIEGFGGLVVIILMSLNISLGLAAIFAEHFFKKSTAHPGSHLAVGSAFAVWAVAGFAAALYLAVAEYRDFKNRRAYVVAATLHAGDDLVVSLKRCSASGSSYGCQDELFRQYYDAGKSLADCLKYDEILRKHVDENEANKWGAAGDYARVQCLKRNGIKDMPQREALRLCGKVSAPAMECLDEIGARQLMKSPDDCKTYYGTYFTGSLMMCREYVEAKLHGVPKDPEKYCKEKYYKFSDPEISRQNPGLIVQNCTKVLRDITDRVR